MANVLGTLFQDIADAIRTKTGGTGTMAPADFPGEILSITGGSAEGRTTVWAEQEVAIDPGDGFGGGPATAALVVGNTYTVTWDGVEYECIADVVVTDASNGFGYPYIGNPALAAEVGAVGDDNGLPFVILYGPRHITGGEFNAIVVYANDTNNHTVGIYTEAVAVKPLWAEQTCDGFVLDSSMGAYMYTVNPSPVDLTVGETYVVKWDGAYYTCVVQDMSAMGEGAVGMGNLVPVGGTGNYEGFIVGCMQGMLFLAAFDNAAAHDVGLYQKQSSGSDEWIFAGGSFFPTAVTHTVEHNLGVVPDIVYVYVQGTGNPSGSLTQVMSAILISEKMFGNATATNGAEISYGAGTFYNTAYNNVVSVGSYVGLENSVASNSGELRGIYDVTETTFTVGGSNQRLSTDFGYSWYAFAKKS